MNIRYAKPIDKDQVVSVWNYCFEDGEDFVKYYFENVYDENNTIIIEENDEVLSALQLNKYTIDTVSYTHLTLALSVPIPHKSTTDPIEISNTPSDISEK